MDILKTPLITVLRKLEKEKLGIQPSRIEVCLDSISFFDCNDDWYEITPIGNGKFKVEIEEHYSEVLTKSEVFELLKVTFSSHENFD